MSKFNVIAAAAVLVASTAASAQGVGEAWDGTEAPVSRAGAFGRAFDSGLTREAVRAEYIRARAAGELGATGEAWDGTFAPARKAGAFGRPFATSDLTRDAVKAELVRARASGELARRQQTDYVGGN